MDEDTTVVVLLIDIEPRGWQTKIIEQIFLPHEVSMIKSISLSESYMEDVFVYRESKDSVHSVRSAYQMLVEEERLIKPSRSNSLRTSKLWSAIWSLEILPKVKHFIWKICSNTIPILSNLLRRKIITDLTCGLCYGDTKDIRIPTCSLELHSFAKCVAYNKVLQVRGAIG